MSLKLGKTAALHFFSQVAVSVAGFVATVAIARFLGADGLGVYALGMSLIVWFNIPLSGFQEALIKRISEGRDQSEYFLAGIALNFVAIVFPAILVVVFRSYINQFVGASVAVLISLLLITNGAFKTVRDTLHAEKKVAHAGWVRFVERILRTTAQVGLLIIGYKIAGLFIGHIAAVVVATGIGFLFVDLRPSLPQRKHFENLIDYGKYSWSTGLKGNAYNWMDTIALGFFVTSSLIGIYEAAWSLASFLIIVSNSISSTLFPEISDISTDEQTQKIKHYLDEAFVFTGVFLIPGLFGAIAVGPGVLRIYSPEFARGSIILLILIAARTVDAYAAQILSAVKALDKPRYALRIDLLFVLVNIVLNFSLIYFYGWYGAAIATLISSGLSLTLSYLAISNVIGRPTVPAGEIGRELFASVVMLACLLGLKEMLPSGIPTTIGLVAVGASIYGLVLLALSGRIRQKALALTPASLSRRVSNR